MRNLKQPEETGTFIDRVPISSGLFSLLFYALSNYKPVQ